MIKQITTFKNATYYWDLCDCRIKDAEFSVFLNGEKILATEKTHFTLENLEADTSYNIEVFARKDSEKLLFIAEKFRTKPTPEFVNVRDYGAKGDGETLDTEAIKRAIDACTAGKTLYFPEGTYMTGSLKLHSNMDVYLEKGATLQGSANPEDYLPKIKTRFEGLTVESYSPLIGLGEMDEQGGINAENVMLYGEGAILGGGRALCDAVIDSETERLADYMRSLGDEIDTYEFPKTIPGRYRPRLISVCNCKNFIIGGLTVGNGPAWNVHMVYCTDALTYNSTIVSQGVWNGDGWNPDSSENCTIFNCDFKTGDDGIAIKSGKNPEGDVINRPTRNVRVFDCRLPICHGLAVGSEMSGGIDGVYIWDCDASNVSSGFSVKGTSKRGGYVKNIYIQRSSFSRICVRSVPFNNDGKASAHPPFFSDIFVENVNLTGQYTDNSTNETVEIEPLSFEGMDEDEYKIRNVTLKDVTIDCNGKCKRHNIALSSIDGLSIINLKVR